MKVIVFGAAGKSGALVVERAKAAGHQVSVFVHEQKENLDGVQVFSGDVTNLADVTTAIAGQDAVIDTIGGKTPWKSTGLESTAARNIIAAMQQHGVRRLVVISMLGVGDSSDHAPFWYEYLMQPTFLHGATKDKTAMEAEVATSGLDFIVARPPILTEDPATGSVKILTGDEVGHKITRADLAQFLVEQLTSDQYLGQAVTVVNS